MKTGLNEDLIGVLSDLSPGAADMIEDWTFKTYVGRSTTYPELIPPNRRTFYMVMMIGKGRGLITIGLNTYYIDRPTLLFVHPNDIFTWKILSPTIQAHFLIFKRSFLMAYPQLKTMLDKFGLFHDMSKRVIKLRTGRTRPIKGHFEKIDAEAKTAFPYRFEKIQALFQLLLVEIMVLAQFMLPDQTGSEFQHIHDFFSLLEEETTEINYLRPIRIKTAKEFAQRLDMHPNYLNAVLKRYTGQNVSVLIKHRLLEESKGFLLHTSWSLQNISYTLGFADQPNFTLFFKRNTGLTPADFRKKYQLANWESLLDKASGKMREAG